MDADRAQFARSSSGLITAVVMTLSEQVIASITDDSRFGMNDAAVHTAPPIGVHSRLNAEPKCIHRVWSNISRTDRELHVPLSSNTRSFSSRSCCRLSRIDRTHRKDRLRIRHGQSSLGSFFLPRNCFVCGNRRAKKPQLSIFCANIPERVKLQKDILF